MKSMVATKEFWEQKTKKRRIGSSKCIKGTKGSVYNQYKVGWLLEKVQRLGSFVCKEKIGGIWRFGILLFNIMHQEIDGRLQCWTKWMVGVSRNII